MGLPELAKRCNIGRGTIYRYVRSEYTIPAAIEEQLGIVLELDGDEKAQLRQLIDESVSHRPMRRAFEVLDSLVFDDIAPEKRARLTGEVLILDRDRHVLSMAEFFDRMLANADKPQFSCALRIAQGIGERFFKQIEEFIVRLLETIPTATVEHLVSSPKDDAAKLMLVLIEIMPFLQYRNYKMMYTEAENLFAAQRMFGQSFYLSTSYDDGDTKRVENFMFSVRDIGSGACLISSDPFLHEFITDEFYDIRKQYRNEWQEFSSYDVGLDFFADLEQNYPTSMINPDFHLTFIPADILATKLRALDPEVIRELVDEVADDPVPPDRIDDAFEAIIAKIVARCGYSYGQPQTCVSSKEGLLEFVQTGRRCDHLKWVPPYTKREMRAIIENVRDRNLDETNDFNFYLTDKPILENRYILEVYHGTGVAIQYNQKRERTRSHNYLFLSHELLEEVFFNYMNDYLPSTHCVSLEETTEYLNYLIKEYLVE